MLGAAAAAAVLFCFNVSYRKKLFCFHESYFVYNLHDGLHVFKFSFDAEKNITTLMIAKASILKISCALTFDICVPFLFYYK